MTPQEATATNPIRLVGKITWIYYGGGSDSASVHIALIRGPNEVVIECLWQGEPYTVPLVSGDGIHFTADFQGKSGGKTWPVKVACKLWSNKSGYLLFGTWVEEGDEMYLMAELSESKQAA